MKTNILYGIIYLTLSSIIIETVSGDKVLIGLLGLSALKSLKEKHNKFYDYLPIAIAVHAWRRYGQLTAGYGGYGGHGGYGGYDSGYGGGYNNYNDIYKSSSYKQAYLFDNYYPGTDYY